MCFTDSGAFVLRDDSVLGESMVEDGREHGKGGCRRTVGSNPVTQRWGDVQRQSVRESNLELTNTVVLVTEYTEYMQNMQNMHLGPPLLCDYTARVSGHISCFGSHSWLPWAWWMWNCQQASQLISSYGHVELPFS